MVVSSLNKGTRLIATFFERSKKVRSPACTDILAELSNTMTSLESCSAANQPGMNPRVTGWAIIIAKHMIASILNNKIINF